MHKFLFILKPWANHEKRVMRRRLWWQNKDEKDEFTGKTLILRNITNHKKQDLQMSFTAHHDGRITTGESCLKNLGLLRTTVKAV